MKKFGFASFLCVVVALVAFAAEQGKEGEKPVSQRTVVVPTDTTSFTVQEDYLVRITGEGIAGSDIRADVSGPAKMLSESSILTMKGGHALLGMANIQFDLKPTGKGTVKVMVTSKPPMASAKTTSKTYQFDVK